MKRTRSQLERRPPQGEGDREAFVTYSRLDADEFEPEDGIHELDATGPLYDAVEVPHIERPRPRGAIDPRLDVRAERDPVVGPDPLEPERRPGRLRYLVLVGLGVIAVVAGVGVLVATVGTSSRVETVAATPAPVSLSPEPEADATGTNRNIREIPIIGEGPAAPAANDQPGETTALAEPTAPIEPPLPRTRPNPPPTATVAIEPGQPAGTVPATVAAPQPAGQAPANEEDFISRIEQTLSRIEGAPAPAAPVIVPAPAAPAPAVSAVAVDEPTDILLDDDVLPTGDDIILDGEALIPDGGGSFDFEARPAPLPVPPASAAAPQSEPMPLLNELVIDPIAPVNRAVPSRLIPPADIPGETRRQ